MAGFPHLIAGRRRIHDVLTESSRLHGVEIIVGALVQKLDASDNVCYSRGFGRTFLYLRPDMGLRSAMPPHLLFPRSCHVVLLRD